MLRALLNFRSAVIGVSVFSGIVNLLMLTSPLFMLQVYDRVVPSHSIPTLTALVILMVTLFIFMGVLDYIRGRILFHIGRHLEESLGDNVLFFVLDSPLRSAKRGAGMQAARDLDQLKQFVGSSGPIAIFDLPWTPVYIAVVFFLHSLLGLVATAGAIVSIFVFPLRWRVEGCMP